MTHPGVTTEKERAAKARHRRFALAGTVALALMMSGLLASACGGGSSSGVASAGPTTTTAQAASQGASDASNAKSYGDAVLFAQCMRSHGVPNFPDPVSASVTGYVFKFPTGLNPSSPHFASANEACRHLLPNGGQLTPQQRAQIQTKLLQFARCMRSHGVANFPDPSLGPDNRVVLSPGTADPNSPQFQAAEKACKSLLPAGGQNL
jgi:hypothetical protein